MNSAERHSGSLARKRPLKWFCAYTWRIGIRKREFPLSPGGGLERFCFIDAPRGHYYADPFILEDEDRTFLFLEDYDLYARHGALACAELDRSLNVVEIRRILAQPYHLSYPQVLRLDGTYYMLPETAAAGRIELYRATAFPWEWKLHKVLLSGQKYQDATLLEHDGKHWLLAGGSSTGLIGQYDQLNLFYAKTIFDPLTPHPANPVKTDIASARPGGAVMRYGDRLIRPAQDCSRWYGCGLNLMEIDGITESHYSERVFMKAPPSWQDSGSIGIHTYNASDHFEVIDVCSYGVDLPSAMGRARLLARPLSKSTVEPVPGIAGKVCAVTNTHLQPAATLFIPSHLKPWHGNTRFPASPSHQEDLQ